MKIVAFAGRQATHEGHYDEDGRRQFDIIRVEAAKRFFALSLRVYFKLLTTLRTQRFDVVLMPIEKKHLPLIFVLVALRAFIRFRLVSYNHPTLKSKHGRVSRLDRLLTRLLFRLYDHIVFYTQNSRDWALREHLVSDDRASYANNTVDTRRIGKQQVAVTNSESRKLLFIGRLVPIKRVDLLFRYFDALVPNVLDLELAIIGDGPQANFVKHEVSKRSGVSWHGAIVEEELLVEHMRTARAVFMPGDSGLSIIHAFCYGKPYVTIGGEESSHGPELDYLVDGHNGLFLDRSFDCNVLRFARFLNDTDSYPQYCEAALKSAKTLKIEDWCAQMENALLKDSPR